MFQKLFTFICVISFSITLFSCEDSKDDDTSLFVLLYSLISMNTTGNATCKEAAFCRTFVATNNGAGFSGNLGGVSGADAKCMAEKPSTLTGSYKALIVAGGNSPRSIVPNKNNWVLFPNKEYRRKDGTTVTFTTNAQAIVTSNLSNGIDGGAKTYFWSGLSSPANGTGLWEEGNNCLEWTSASGVEPGQAGNTAEISADLTPEGAFTIDTHACNSNLKLLCVEQ
ncbi:DUF1554 domain-containing protein [Leptospira adleri]|uniref:DUF1554 domain-containing protein n=1 Tax=Leptospira adleri TaxID=2023186 RepID=A0A2M9YKD2_9LEPT|nr:DUF1554 domain-containing protein [Leptospira adleri]PJZ51991.1 hypothetical protein CH380_17330 [Leptospira adleri]PJZ60782.1 hypothetical protein CH376_16775 [Leptospira adleri]